jgi:hypothetical protein
MANKPLRSFRHYAERCDDCGKFFNPLEKGASSAAIYDLVQMEAGYLHFRCSFCTKKLGPVHSNARPADGDMSPYESQVTI